MSIELMLNAVNINLIAFGAFRDNVIGQVFALFVIAIAAAEVGRRPGHRPAHLPQPGQRRPRRGRPDEGLGAPSCWRTPGSSPCCPAVSFVLILVFGKRLPEQGRRDRHRRPGRSPSSLSLRRAPSSGSARHEPTSRGRPPPHLVRAGRGRHRRRHPHRRPDRDDAGRRHLHLAAGARLLHRLHARRPPLHLLLRRPLPVHRLHAPAGRVRQHPPAADRLGAGGPVLVHAHRPLVGGGGQLRAPPSRPSSPPAPATSA